LTAACVLAETASKIGAVYIGKIKNMAKNIDACFVEISDGEICFLPLKKAVSPYLLNRIYDGRLVEGDTLLVQIERDPQKGKQASVTAHISLSNDYFVVTMGSKHIFYSSKFDKEQREMLHKYSAMLLGENVVDLNGGLVQNWDSLLSESSKKRLAADNISVKFLPLPSTGCIIRTMAAAKFNSLTAADAAKKSSFPEENLSGNTLSEHFFQLTEQYARLLHTARYRSCFTCLKEAPCAVESVLRGLVSEHEYQEIVTDSQELYEMLSKYSSDAKGIVLENVQESVQESISENAQKSVQESFSENVQENVPESIFENVQKIVPESISENVQKSVQESIFENVQKSVQESISENVQEKESAHNKCKSLRLYQDEMLSLSKLYSIESKMETALGSRVWLKSGGYLIIEPTEALTVIDVNSGKYEAKKSNEDTVLAVNLEAAEEVALQLRLRNLSGIIIVDFINMAQETSKNQIMTLLKQLTAKDVVKTTVVDMTSLGLVEITRKKTSKPLREQLR
jgi:Ribonuclease G/E